jgi:hypothetical protein
MSGGLFFGFSQELLERNLGRNYREIERIQSEKCGIHAPRCTIKDFVRQRLTCPPQRMLVRKKLRVLNGSCRKSTMPTDGWRRSST